MFDLTNSDLWPDQVRGYETTDPVLGGAAGESNLPLEDLTDRTYYLFRRLHRWESVNVIPIASSGAAALGLTEKGKLNYIQAAGNATVNIADAATFQAGHIIPITIRVPQGKMVTFQSTGGQIFDNGTGSVSDKFYAADGETFELIAAGTFFIVMNQKGNWDKVGQDYFLRFQPKNSILANGCTPEQGSPLLKRADYPRLWAVYAPVAIADVQWLSGQLNRGFPSQGDGVTTFRPPDLRGMFMRGLDLGSGIRLGNIDNRPGSYEDDALKAHAHSLPGIPLEKPDSDRGTTGGHSNFSMDDTNSIANTGSTGGTETRPKNMGLFPIIYY